MNADLADEIALWKLTGVPSTAVCEAAVRDLVGGRPVDYLPASATECWEGAVVWMAGGPPSFRRIIEHRDCATCEALSVVLARLHVRRGDTAG